MLSARSCGAFWAQPAIISREAASPLHIGRLEAPSSNLLGESPRLLAPPDQHTEDRRKGSGPIAAGIGSYGARGRDVMTGDRTEIAMM
jgi:hypothetical protein